jgi:hypothetical protein
MKRWTSVLLAVFCTHFLMGQSCCSGGVPVSSNLGFQSEQARTLQLSLQADFNVLKSLYAGSDLLEDRLRKRTTQSYLLRMAYAVSNRSSLELFFPLVRQTRKIYTNQNTVDFESSFGLGDPVLLFVFNVLNGPFAIRLGAGPQIPLGSFEEKNGRGLFLVEDLQPGSGAWDLVLFGSVEHIPNFRPSMFLYSNVIISRNGINDASRGGFLRYRFGHDVQVILGVSDQLLALNQSFQPNVSLRYRKAQRDQIDGFPNSGTGGEFLFVKLGTGINVSRNTGTFSFQLELPLYTFVNETQLAPTYSINVGWTKKLLIQSKNTSIPSL